jgi:hypothetical protein
MLIDPSMFTQVWWIVAIAIPIVLLDDLIITAILAYFLGFSSRASTSMSAALCGRGAESVMYATVGSRSVGVTKGSELYPFAGAFCFIMSAITPLLMRKSNWISDKGSSIVPKSLGYSGTVISKTLGKLVLPSSFSPFRRTRRMGVALILYLIALVAVIATSDVLHVVTFGVAVMVTVGVWRVLLSEVRPVTRNMNYSNLGGGVIYNADTGRFVSLFVFIGLLAVLAVAFLFTYYWQSVLIVLVIYFAGILILMRNNYKGNNVGLRTEVGTYSDDLTVSERGHEVPVASDSIPKKSRWKRL